jgi:hypothetical protein
MSAETALDRAIWQLSDASLSTLEIDLTSEYVVVSPWFVSGVEVSWHLHVSVLAMLFLLCVL